MSIGNLTQAFRLEDPTKRAESAGSRVRPPDSILMGRAAGPGSDLTIADLLHRLCDEEKESRMRGAVNRRIKVARRCSRAGRATTAHTAAGLPARRLGRDAEPARSRPRRRPPPARVRWAPSQAQRQSRVKQGGGE
jgi:hypothetical protein